MRGPRFTLEPDSPGEDVQIWLPEHLEGIQLMLARNCRRHWKILHGTFALCHVPIEGNDPAGCSHWWYRGNEYECPPGGMIVVEPGEVHVTRRLHRPASFYWAIEVPPALVQSAAGDMAGDTLPHLRIAQTQSPRLYATCDRLLRALTRDESSLEQQTRLASYVRILLEECGERAPVMPRRLAAPAVRRAREYLHAHYTEAIPLEQLAAVAGVSRFHLAHLFMQAVGVPPHAYQNRLRIAAACRLLRAGVQPADIDVGFSDQSHLGRHFRRIVGTTPARYAATVRGSRAAPRTSVER